MRSLSLSDIVFRNVFIALITGLSACNDVSLSISGNLDFSELQLCLLAEGTEVPKTWSTDDDQEHAVGELLTLSAFKNPAGMPGIGVNLVTRPETLLIYAEGVDSQGCVVSTGQVSIARSSSRSELVMIPVVPQSCRLTVTANGPGTVAASPSGDVSSSTSSLVKRCKLPYVERYASGTQVTLTPQPGPSAHFTGWGPACATNAASCTVSIRPGLPAVEVNFSAGLCTAPPFCWENPLPQGNVLRGVWADADGALYAVGDSGTILHRAGETAGFVPESSKTSRNLYGVSGARGSAVFAVGEGGDVLTKKGSEWSSVPYVFDAGMPNKRPNWFSVYAETPPLVQVTGDDADLLQSSGTSWDRVTPGSVYRPLYQVWGPSLATQYAVGGSRGVVTISGGVPGFGIPCMMGASPLRGVWGTAAQVWFAGQDGALYRFDPSGKKCEVEKTAGGAADPQLFGLSGASSDEIWAVGERGSLLYRSPTGAMWKEVSAGQKPVVMDKLALRSVYGVTNGTLYAVGDSGLILQRRSGSAEGAWEVEPNGRVPDRAHELSKAASHPELPVRSDLLEVAGRSLQDVWAVARDGSVLHWDGQVWSVDLPAGPVGSELRTIWVTPTQVWVAGTAGAMLRRGADGWEQIRNVPMIDGLSVEITDITGSPDRLMIVGDKGLIATAATAGDTVVKLCPLSTERKKMHAAWATGDDVVIVSYSDTTLMNDPNVYIWDLACSRAIRVQKTNDTSPLYGVYATSVDDIWAAGYQRILHKVGESWTKTDVPGETFRAVHGSGDKVWFAGQNGLLWTYDSVGGLSRQQPGTTNDILGIWSASPQVSWFVGTSGMILRYTKP